VNSITPQRIFGFRLKCIILHTNPRAKLPPGNWIRHRKPNLPPSKLSIVGNAKSHKHFALFADPAPIGMTPNVNLLDTARGRPQPLLFGLLIALQ
jgi:hypothetical protein